MAKRERATFDALVKKRRVEREVIVKFPGEAGDEEELTLLFRAIGSAEYDKLVDKCPPTPQQKKEGAVFDIDRFAPLLISRVCVDPPLSVDDARDIWASDEWNRGEVMNLFTNAIEVCTQGFEIPPTGRG